MDPQACLDRILTASTPDDVEDAMFAREELYQWLAKGGALPNLTRIGWMRFLLALDFPRFVTE
jgi:hypothetical protein